VRVRCARARAAAASSASPEHLWVHTLTQPFIDANENVIQEARLRAQNMVMQQQRLRK
jgi:hypothetical protein